MEKSGQQSGQQANKAGDSKRELVTKAEFARRQKWDRSMLSKKEVLDKIRPAIVPGKNGREMIDPVLAAQLYADSTDQSKVRKEEGPRAPAAGSLADTKARREELRLEAERMDLAEKKGMLLPRAETMAAISSAGTLIREHLQARNRRLAEQASTMTDPREIKAMLDADDRAMFEMISHDFAQRIPIRTEGGEQPTIN